MFCLQLEKETQVGVAKFKEINRLNINDLYLTDLSQCVLKFLNL